MCLTNMGQLQNTLLTLAILTTLLSCADNEHNFVKRKVPVDIYESTIPTHGIVNQDTPMQLKAQATNGCHSNLEIKLTQTDSKHFLLKGTAIFQTNGICPDIMVYKDTMINFRPTSTGDYFFQVNEDPFEIKTYKLEIN